ncbi:MAG: hypothetical protein WBF73_24215 [Bradyrhizobium sp.]|jgi:hypothetical protein
MSGVAENKSARIWKNATKSVTTYARCDEDKKWPHLEKCSVFSYNFFILKLIFDIRRVGTRGRGTINTI